MSKFNTAGTSTARIPNTVNRAGGPAFKITNGKQELADVVLASMLNGDSYYESDKSRIAKILSLVASLSEEDKVFAAKAMVYARNDGNLRSVAHVLANALATSAAGNSYVRSAVRKILIRPDDMTEIAALWFSNHADTMLPNSFRRAFKDVLDYGKWDAYQLNKYKGESNAVKLKDIIKIVHPVDIKGYYGQLLSGTLVAPASLETKLASGTKANVAFEQMLSENRLGYMAAMKNIRNALETGISDTALDMWCALVSNPKAVRKSRMLPFRYVDAWNAIKHLNVDSFKLRKVKNAINAAMVASAYNLDMYTEGEKVALIVDESGSMGGASWDHAIVLAAVMNIAFGSENVVVYKFGSVATQLDFHGKLPLDVIDGVSYGGGSTYFHTPFEKLIASKTNVDKIIMLTDMQLYSADQAHNGWYNSGGVGNQGFTKYLDLYKKAVNKNVKVLFWDLAGHGESTPLKLDKGVLLASGFSDKLLGVIPKIWKDKNALVNLIEAIEI